MKKQRAGSDREEEARLVARMVGGDEAAFRAFFNAYYPRLVSFASSRSSMDAASLDDAVQATLIKGIRGLSGYRGDSALFTWLCSICWHELATLRRRQQSLASIESLESLPESEISGLRASVQSEPDRVLDADFRRSEITHALDALPERYARALEMKYVEGRAVCELADALGVTVVGAQSLLARAREAFRLAFPQSLE